MSAPILRFPQCLRVGPPPSFPPSLTAASSHEDLRFQGVPVLCSVLLPPSWRKQTKWKTSAELYKITVLLPQEWVGKEALGGDVSTA